MIPNKNVFNVIIGWSMRNIRASALQFHAVRAGTLHKVCAK